MTTGAAGTPTAAGGARRSGAAPDPAVAAPHDEPRQLIGASTWEAELYALLTASQDEERALQVEYQEAADASQSDPFRFLVGLILDDERRHLELLEGIAAGLRNDVELTEDRSAVPRLDHWGPDRDYLREAADHLVDRERDTLRKLRRLAHKLEEQADVTMWKLLVDLVRADTEQHLAILDFVRRHAR
ncbi:MAG TPA: hypothetical protein VHB02_12860 [Acidimicrobiales bacterium]|nr:hypothetical protein [Acidimicrobiales bacterium]